MNVISWMLGASALCVVGCAPTHAEVRPTPRPDQPAHEDAAPRDPPRAAPAPALGPRVHVSQRGITLDDVPIERKPMAASSPGSEDAELLAGLEASLAQRPAAATPEDTESTAAHYVLTVEPEVPFRLVQRIMRTCARAGHFFVRLSCGNATFDLFVEERSPPGAKPLLEMHELGIRVDGGALAASVFHVEPSSINRGMFQRTLRVERSLPRDTSPGGLSAFTSAVADMAPPHCSEPDAPCFDRLSLDVDDAMPFGEITSILAALRSGLPPGIALPWAAGASLRLAPLRVGTFHPDGVLPAEHVRSVVQQNFEPLRKCHADGLRRNPKLAGIVRVSFTIDLEGKVTEAVEAPEPSDEAKARAQTDATFVPIRDPKMVSCVLSVFAKLQFARQERWGVKAIYPIRFTP